MTTKLPGNPKIATVPKSVKLLPSTNFAHYETVLLPSPSTRSPVVPAKPIISSALRATSPPSNYVNPERLMDDVAQLYAARDRVFASLDVLDAASRNAGTPVRSGSPRERFTHLFGIIREVETTARKAWQDELIAGGANLSLSRALTVGAKNDALYVTKLTCKDADTNSGEPNANDREGRNADPDRTPNPSAPSDHDGESSETLNPNALPFKARTGLPKLVPLKRFGYSVRTVDLVRRLLEDGGWGTDRITHGELLKLVALFEGTTPSDANQAIGALSDAELKLVADDMDSNGLGNYEGLSTAQKESFIAKLATQLDAKQFVRIAKAFNDDVQIASVLARTSDTQHLTADFIAYCESKFSAKGNEETKQSAALATAITIANLRADGLARFIAKHRNNEVFLSQVFAEASGHTKTEVYSYDFLGARTTRIIHHFDPTLLTRINQTALLIAQDQEASRFEVFKRTISSLEWIGSTSNSSADGPAIKTLLLAATNVQRVNLATQLDLHSDEQETYVSWITMLIRSRRDKEVTDLITEARAGASGDYRWAGYLLGILMRATNNLNRDLGERIDFASNLVSALLNAAPLAGQVGGELFKSTVAHIRSSAKPDMSVSDLISLGLKKALKGPEHIAERDRLNLGLLDAISASLATDD